MEENTSPVPDEQPQQVALQQDGTEVSHDGTEVVSQEVVAAENVDVDKTLYDAEEFLTNFAGLRLENDQLKRSNEELQQQLEKARQEVQELQMNKVNLEATLHQEREQHKEALWKIRSDFQKIQEERLQWKEKYLNACMKGGTSMSGVTSGGKIRAGKRKNPNSENENEEFYTNLASSFGLTNQDEQPEEIVLTLVSEQSKSYKISIRECPHCGVGFCSTFGLREHLKSCESRKTASPSTVEAAPTSPAIGTGETYHCEPCNVDFPTESDLAQHNQYHQGTHKYLCRTCFRSYQSNPGRLKHEQLEHGAVPLLICDICGRQFKRKDRLKDHFATKHSLATPHECPYCDAAYKLRDYLRKHVNAMHPGKTLLHANAILKEELLKEEQVVSMEVTTEQVEEVVENNDGGNEEQPPEVNGVEEEIVEEVAMNAGAVEVQEIEETEESTILHAEGMQMSVEISNE